MAIHTYLAMTAAEIDRISPLPPEIAWMACHFSPYSTGISNLPPWLPEGSLLMLNDVTPIHGHDPQRVAEQLAGCIERCKCMGVLLDFQREKNEELEAMATFLIDALPCPVGWSQNDAGPVFVPPVPCSAPLAEYIAPWKDKEVWLELALSSEQLRLTDQGCVSIPLSPQDIPAWGQKEDGLHCHYQIELSDDDARFTLWRTREDLQELLENTK